MPYAKNTIKVKVQQRSGFDKSHRNSGTLRCGTITPILCDELIPNSRVSLRLNLAAQLPPLVSDTYMNCKLRVEAFFTPSRLLCKSFEPFFCDVPERYYDEQNFEWKERRGIVPRIFINAVDSSSSNVSPLLGRGSLADYLGCKVSKVSAGGFSINPLPFINYHLVWQEWYRNPRVQNPAFSPSLHYQSDYDSDPDKRFLAFKYPYTFFDSGSIGSTVSVSSDDPITDLDGEEVMNLADGVSLWDLRQRNFSNDYFTGSRVSAQQGAAVSVNVVGPETATSEGTFTIAALRAANSLQQFRERNNLPSSRLVDQVRARYGANLSDGVAQRPICIGSASYNISTRGVDQTSPTFEGDHYNPFSGVAAQYGRAFGAGSDFIIKDFTANEPGYLLVNVTLVPEVTYDSGISPMFTRYASSGSITDMACSLLQNVGDQPIKAQELMSIQNTSAQTSVFGYQDRFADFMYMPNSAHGEFRSDGSLSSFVLQRSFNSVPELNSAFLTIPTDYMDGVFAASDAVSKVSAWYDCMLDYKVSMPLAEWSLPSLQDPAYEHGNTISLIRNGQIF